MSGLRKGAKIVQFLMRLAAPLLVLGAAAAAWADDTNFRPYLLGSRAAGMGGAFTALADDGSGAYYNPGGLAFAQRSSISLSGSVYGLVRGSYANLLIDSAGNPQQFDYSALNLFPTVTAAVRKLGDNDTLHAEVLVPDSFRIDERQSIVSATNAFAFAVETQSLWIGGGWAHRFGRLGVGVGAHLLLETAITQLDLNAINAQDPGRFAAISAREDISTLAFVGSFGARLDLTDQLRLGAALYLPAFGRGSRKEFVRVLVGRDVGAPGNPPNSVVHANSNLSATPATPLRLQLGAAWASGPLTLAADVVLLGPRDVRDDPDQASLGLDRHVVRKTTFNFSAGAEFVAAAAFPLRAGFFTDLAGSQSPAEIGSGEQPTNTLHLNRYGFSASAGYRTDHVSTDVGINLSTGSGTEYLPYQLDFTDIRPEGADQFLTYVFLATSYEF